MHPKLRELKEQHESIQRVEMPNGWIVHIKAGLLHREDGPAVTSDNHQEWYQNGILHRDDGPARMFHLAPDGNERIAEWWFSGQHQLSASLDHSGFHSHLHKGS